jgi:MFS family permease
VFAASPLLVGLLGSGYGLGMVVSPVLLLGPGRRLAPASVFCLALAAFGLGTGLTGLSPVLALAICGQVLAGAGNGWENVGAETLIQQTVPADRLGTVFGTVYAFPYGAELIAYLAGGPLLEHYGPRVTLVIAGLGVLGTLLLAYPLLASVRRPATVLLPPTPASVDPSS